MEINPCPDAISHHQFHFLVVPSLRRTAGPVGDDEPVPATAGLAAEGADEVSRRGPAPSPACYHCAPVPSQLRRR